MRAAMPFVRILVLAAASILAVGCGSEIGDSCSLTSDCNPSGDEGRTCDQFSPQGYCTQLGCDFDTCPEESVCIAFFTGSFSNTTCDPLTEDLATDSCALDELCAIDGHCVPRSAEIRYCMRTCGDQGDCRGQYECRDLELMKQHGGQPVLAPGETLGADVPSFCAPAPI
jgi:hypothetical protein